MADLAQATEYVARDLEEGQYFDEVSVQQPGIILVSNEGQHFEIKIEEI